MALVVHTTRRNYKNSSGFVLFCFGLEMFIITIMTWVQVLMWRLPWKYLERLRVRGINYCYYLLLRPIGYIPISSSSFCQDWLLFEPKWDQTRPPLVGGEITLGFEINMFTWDLMVHTYNYKHEVFLFAHWSIHNLGYKWASCFLPPFHSMKRKRNHLWHVAVAYV